jgi:hypothetical protein
MKILSKIFTCIAILSMLAAIALIIVFTIWLNFPYKPLKFNQDLLPIVNKTVKQGESLQYVADYCKYVDLTAQVSKRFVNGLIYTTPTTLTNQNTGCHTVTVFVPIPPELPPGNYYLSNIYQYKMNPLRTVTIIQNTEWFEVIK